MADYQAPTIVVSGKRSVLARVIAEKVLGRSLPTKAVIHHANENGLDNSNSNLVICPDEAYHNLLHTRLRAYKATGNAGNRKCLLCGLWDLPENMQHKKNAYAGAYRHAKCISLDNKLQIQRKIQRIKESRKQG